MFGAGLIAGADADTGFAGLPVCCSCAATAASPAAVKSAIGDSSSMLFRARCALVTGRTIVPEKYGALRSSAGAREPCVPSGDGCIGDFGASDVPLLVYFSLCSFPASSLTMINHAQSSAHSSGALR